MGEQPTATMIKSDEKPFSAATVAPGQTSEDPLVGLAVIEDAPVVNEIQDVEIQSVPCVSWCADWLFLPMGAPLCGFYTVPPMEAVANIHCGYLTGVEDEPGIHYTANCGRHQKHTSLKQQTMEIPTAKVADGNGNPINISCIVNYRVVDPKKAMLNVEDLKKYVNTNAQAVLKQTVSHYTYDQLKTDYNHVNEQMRQQLIPLLKVAGVDVSSMSLNDLAYAPEVAAAMLKKQQARALIEARTLIVEGACRIAQDAVSLLERDSSIALSDEAKVKIVSNLLTVTCSESEATPTLGLS